MRRGVVVRVIVAFVCCLAGVAAGQPLVVLGDQDLAPYEFFQGTLPTGANVELAQAVGRLLGRPVEVRLMNWDEAQAKVLAGEADVLTMLGRTPEREQRYLFSQPTVPVSFAVFVRADEVERMRGGLPAGLRVGVTRGGLARQHLQRNAPHLQLVPVDNLVDGTRRLLQREIDAFAAQEWSEYYLLSERGIRGVVGLEAFERRHGQMAVRADRPELAAQVDGALSALKASGELDRIIDRWSHTRVHLFSRSAVVTAGVATAAAVVALLVLAGLVLSLRRQRAALRGEIARREALERQLRASDAQLQALMQTKDRLFAAVAHELRNHLAPISNASHVIGLLSAASPGPLERPAGIVARQTAQLGRLVDDLLDIGRADTGKLELRRERLQLERVVAESVDAARAPADARRQTLTWRPPERSVTVEGDHQRLSQVFTNLLSNAVKYTPEGGLIDVRMDPLGDEVRVVVSDTGAGIAASELPRVFEMFYQEERSRKGSQSGLGIGLWLTRRLVAMHGGSVHAESDGEGRGSVFTVRLHLARTEAASDSTAA